MGGSYRLSVAVAIELLAYGLAGAGAVALIGWRRGSRRKGLGLGLLCASAVLLLLHLYLIL